MLIRGFLGKIPNTKDKTHGTAWRERSITRSTFEKAYEKLFRDQVGEGAPKRIVGPKTLNVYGAPYVWAVFTGIGMIEEEQYVQQEMQF